MSASTTVRFLIDLQNPCGFNGLPDIDDLETWSESSYTGKNSDKQTFSLVIRVVDKEESALLNSSYRNKEGATNILSFSNDLPDFMAEIPEIKEQPQHLGDLVICEPILKNEAIKQNKTLQQHWAHLIIHGVLHLQGYDHINDDDTLEMETLEIKILEQLNFDNPY